MRVTSFRRPSPRHCAQKTELLSKKCCSWGLESRSQNCIRFKIDLKPTKDLNLIKPPATETRTLLLDHLADLTPL